MSVRVIRSVALFSVGAAVLAGCGAPQEGSVAASSAPATSSAAAACTKDSMRLVTPGKFTVGTDRPAYEPWFVSGDPKNGKGYESAVAYAVAKKLGFNATGVTWVSVPFNKAHAPGPKNFDVDLNQVSITDARRQAVDFSSGYYDVAQAVVTYAGSPIEKASSMADLKSAKLGAQVGTTSYSQAIQQQIKPTAQARVFDTNDLGVAALKSKLIDGLVVDLPTAFYVANAQLSGGKIVGQLPAAAGAKEQFGMVLPKGSSITQCVSQAVDSLRADGTLASLQAKWLAGAGAPVLK